MTRTLLIGLVAIIIIGGGFAAFSMSRDDTTDTSTTSRSTTPNTTSNSPSPASSNAQNNEEESLDDDVNDASSTTTTISYSDNGFSPSSVTVKSGDSVQIKNTSTSDELQFYSDPHPQHTNNDELNVGTVMPGETKTFNVSEKGTFGYHNHLDASQKGSITVQ